MLSASQDILAVQYLTFLLDGEMFGVDVRETREILDLPPLTRIPQSPEYMLGAINLRGAIVPVVDLRRRFVTAKNVPPGNPCVIVVEVHVSNETLVLGVLADEVCEVIDLNAEQIQPPPRLGSRIRTDYLKGIGQHQERFVILLEMAKIFGGEELEQLQGAAA